MRAGLKVIITLCAKGLSAEVTLEGFFSCVCAEVHVEVGFLGKGVVAELAHERTLVPEEKGKNASHHFTVN